MNTLFLLLAKFERSPVALSEVCEEYFGIKERQASMLAATQQLPIPAFKLRDSERAKWMIDLRDLSEHIDSRRNVASSVFKQVNNVPRRL